MPVYCYRREDTGKIEELVMSIAEKERRENPVDKSITLPDGVIGKRDIFAEQHGFKHTPGNWPMYSDAAGVLPEQRKEAYEYSKKMGVPTQFDSEGRAVFTSKEHRKNYCEKVAKLRDRNAGYSDPTL